MRLEQVREKYLRFFEKNGHKIITSSRIVPENDPTTLFTGSGMQPMVPFLLGADHPMGKRISNSQKCFRAEDIDEIGDNRHTTFFEMLGNWSLGDYFKKEQINFVFEFLTKELKIPPEKLFITVFAGNSRFNIPKDEESEQIWRELFAKSGIEATSKELLTEELAGQKGMDDARIFYYASKKNWWSRWGVEENMPVGEPGGPDSEIFYEFENVKHDEKYGKYCHPNCDCGRFVEIGNCVFMEYIKTGPAEFSMLPRKNVDFGGGLERITAATDNSSDVFKIDVFQEIVEKLEKLSLFSYEDNSKRKSFRIIADHIRGVVFMIADNVLPTNSDAGYFARRLLRRAIRHMDILKIEKNKIHELVSSVILSYKDAYPEILKEKDKITEEIIKEEKKFRQTLEKGVREFGKIKEDQISSHTAFKLFSTYGLPVDIISELAEESGKIFDKKGFEEEFKSHKNLSKEGSEKKFKGGLASHGEMEVKYHTATHLLNAALRKVLGDHVSQRGSNITSDRLRFDFSHPDKLSAEEIKCVEDLVNEKIKEFLPVSFKDISKEEARKNGAIGVFDDKYGEVVRVYSIGESANLFSFEICGGPHAQNTSELGHFKIKKEESVSSGVRRIKAILEKNN